MIQTVTLRCEHTNHVMTEHPLPVGEWIKCPTCGRWHEVIRATR